MKPSELFFPIGWLALSKEQSEQIKSTLGKSVDAVPIYNVVAVGGADRYLPFVGVPGLVGVIIHYDSHPEPGLQGRQVIASLLDEMAQESEEGRVFAAHTKLMAPRRDEGRAAPEKSKSK